MIDLKIELFDEVLVYVTYVITDYDDLHWSILLIIMDHLLSEMLMEMTQLILLQTLVYG